MEENGVQEYSPRIFMYVPFCIICGVRGAFTLHHFPKFCDTTPLLRSRRRPDPPPLHLLPIRATPSDLLPGSPSDRQPVLCPARCRTRTRARGDRSPENNYSPGMAPGIAQVPRGWLAGVVDPTCT